MPARVALVVSIGHYEHHHSLELCPPSAEEVFELLISPEYGMCDCNRSVLKTAREGEFLTASDLYRVIRQVIYSLQVGDQFLFSFSGHAELHHDKLFLTTTDSEKPQQGYRFSDLVDSLNDNDVDKAIVVIDACHSEAMFDSIKNLQSSEWSPHDLPKGFGFMAASGKFGYARQKHELGRTLFSYYFCEGIRNGINTEGQYITLPALKKYINSEIERNFKGEKPKVHTWIGEGDVDIWLSKNITPSLKPILDQPQDELSLSSFTPKWIIAIGLFLLLVLSITIFVVYSRFYQPYISIQATNQAILATFDSLASTSTAAAIQVETNPFDKNVISTATASARELATAQAVLTAAFAATPGTSTPTATPTSTATPLPGITKIRPADKAVMVLVSAGDFLMGSDTEDNEADSDEKPRHLIWLDEYWIDRFEVTNSQYKKFIDTVGHAVPFIDAGWAAPYSWTNGTYPEGLANYPVVLVDWNDAKAYCSWAGGRLPTEAEWEKAARGNDGRIYPWGDETATCDYSIINNGVLGCGTNGIWPVGSKPDGVSPYGAVDLAGNVWEWTSSLYKNYPYNPDDGRETIESEQKRVIRGGSWDDIANRVRSAYRLDVSPESQNISLGFRCIVSEKTSMATPTLANLSTNTVTPIVESYETPPLLINPEPSSSSHFGRIVLEWDWPGSLKEDDYFEVEIWDSGRRFEESEPPAIDVAWVKNEYYVIDIGNSSVKKEYQWRVVVVRGKPLKEKDWSTSENQIWEPNTDFEYITQPSELRSFYTR